MDSLSTLQSSLSVEYTVIGAGPAGICAIAKLLSLKIPPNHIAWVDPNFQVGAFGTTLSLGSSLPSNTTVGNFQAVNQSIYETVFGLTHTPWEATQFTISTLAPEAHCSLKIAAEPIQKISDLLSPVVRAYRGNVVSLQEHNKSGFQSWQVNIREQTGAMVSFTSQRVLLATGAQPKQLPFTLVSSLPIISLNTALVATELQRYLTKQTSLTPLKKVAVMGSSHSAALVVMNLIKANIPVKQLMNKPYRFATARTTTEGLSYTQFDNTGLKGEVALYVKALLEKPTCLHTQVPASLWEHTIYTPDSPLSEKDHRHFEKQLQDCSHLIVAIGYEVLPTLTINDKPVNQYHYDKQTTRFFGLPGLYGLGIAFPQSVQSPSGEVEYAVGYSKFWATVNQTQVIESWQNAE